MLDVIVIGAGPAGVVAALRAADLGAKTALITRDEFGGMAANDGPVPVRTLAHAARLIRLEKPASSVSTASLSASRCWTTRGCSRAWARSLTMCKHILPFASRSIPWE